MGTGPRAAAPQQAPPAQSRLRSLFGGKAGQYGTTVYLIPLVAVTLVLVLVPFYFMFYGALRSGSFGAPDAAFTLDKVQMVYTTKPYLEALLNTIILSSAVAAAALVIGTLLAWLIGRTDLPLRQFVEVMVLSPLFLSPFIGAVAWLILGSPRAGLINVFARETLGHSGALINITSVGGAIWVLMLYYVPYAYLFVIAALRNMDPSLEESSYLNGAGILETARRITLPLVKPAILSGFFFIFVLSAGMFSVPAVLIPSGFTTLPVLIYRSVNIWPTDYARAAALGTMLFWLTLIGIYVYRRVTQLSRRYVTVTARGFRPRRVPLGPWRIPALMLCFGYLFFAMVLPYLSLLFVSFTRYVAPRLDPSLFTLNNFRDIFTSTMVQDALKNTLLLAVMAPTACVILGLLLAFVVQRLKPAGSGFLEYLATFPVAIPGIVFATGMLWAYVRTPIYGTIWILLLAYIANYLPQSFRISNTAILQIDSALEEASALCGGTVPHTIRRVTLPLVTSSIMSAWIMVFIFTTREISSSILLYGPSSMVLSVLTWDYLQYGDLQKAAIIGILQTLFLVGAILLAKSVFKVKLTDQEF